MSKRDMFHNPQIRYVGWWQGDILCDWKHTHTHTHTHIDKSNEGRAGIWLWTQLKWSFRQSRAVTSHTKTWKLSRETDCWPKSLEMFLLLYLVTSVTLQIIHTRCYTHGRAHSKVWVADVREK